MRRCVGALICALPLVLALVCALWPRAGHSPRHSVGLVLVLVACALALLNFHLSFIRPWLHVRRHGTQEGYQFISGLPVLGTVLQAAGCAIGFGSVLVGVIGLVSGFLDTAGLPWFAVATWKDTSFWDE